MIAHDDDGGGTFNKSAAIKIRHINTIHISAQRLSLSIRATLFFMASMLNSIELYDLYCVSVVLPSLCVCRVP